MSSLIYFYLTWTYEEKHEMKTRSFNYLHPKLCLDWDGNSLVADAEQATCWGTRCEPVT